MILGTILASILGYLIGSVNFSIIIVYFKTKKDVRKHGSKNAGATNASRMIGKKWGLVIVLLDGLKVILAGMIAAAINLIPSELFSKTIFVIPLLFALIGHCWPVYYKFKGGKAVSCFIGMTIFINLILFAVFTVVWWFTIFIFRKISLSSILACTATIVVAWVPQVYGLFAINLDGSAFTQVFHFDKFYASWFNLMHEWPTGTTIWYENIVIINTSLTLGGIILIFKHRSNIKRLVNRTEPNYFEWRKPVIIENNETKENKKKN